jgi:hypothetical protein
LSCTAPGRFQLVFGFSEGDEETAAESVDPTALPEYVMVEETHETA